MKRHRFDVVSAVVALLVSFALFAGVQPAEGSPRVARTTAAERAQARKAAKAEFAADLLAQAAQVRPMNEAERLESEGHFAGIPLVDVAAFEAKAATTLLVQPGVFRVYNASSGTARYIMQFRIRSGRQAFVQEIPLNLPAGSVIELTLNRWGRYRARAFADNNADGFRTVGDTLVAKQNFWLVKRWWKRNGTSVRSLVLTGGVGPNPNPNPNPSGYPNGATIFGNGLAGNKFLVIGSVNSFQYAFPSVPFQSWGYVTGYYGNLSLTSGFAEAAGGAATITRQATMAGPASASAPAAVWSIQ